MGHEFDRYKIDPGYTRPDSLYDPLKPSPIEGYTHPPKPQFKQKDWDTVYSKLDEVTQERLRKIDWHADYSRLSEEIRTEIEKLALEAVSSFSNHDLVSALSDELNIHRYDVVGAIAHHHSKERIRIVNSEGIRGFELKTEELKAEEPVALTSSAA